MANFFYADISIIKVIKGQVSLCEFHAYITGSLTGESVLYISCRYGRYDQLEWAHFHSIFGL